MRETILDILARRAREQNEATAYTFLADGSLAASSLTFGQLEAAARGIGARLLERAQPGDRALLVYEAGLDFVSALLGCFYAGVTAVPMPAPEASRLQGSIPRLKAVMDDCGAHLLLGNARTHSLLRAAGHKDSENWIDTHEWAKSQVCEEILGTLPADVRNPSLSTNTALSHGFLHSFKRQELAYLQYTSGSTTTAKGVMISHDSLARHLAGMQTALGYDADSVSVCWMPHFHDYGLVEGILLPLFNGTPAYLMSPFAFLKRPVCWLEAISKYGGTHTQAFDFAYRYCARRVTAEDRARLDLRSLRSAGNGGEAIHPKTGEEFYAAFAECGLRPDALAPVFGLAEATLLLTAKPVHERAVSTRFAASALAQGKVDAGGDHVLVGCGRPLPETEIAIVDPDTRMRAKADEVGEIWVSAPGVAAGYWGCPEESEATFRARIVGEEGSYLRTGDLGFVHAGQLYVSSRLKDLIIIRGLNHSPQDIERTVQQAHPSLRPDNCAAFSIQVDGEERLCVVQEVERAEYSDALLDEIFAAICDAVAEMHGISVYGGALIRRASIPKTTSGKIQRHACRDGYVSGSIKSWKRWPAMENSGTRTDALLVWLRDYAEQRIDSRLIDERRCVPPNVVLDFGNRGIFGLQAPKQYGGLELSHSDTMRVYQQMAAVDVTLATMVFLHNTNGTRPVLHHAGPSLRDELMPLLARGRELGAFALSEPGAGSNLGGLETKIVPDGNRAWRIYGHKRWNATGWCGVISVFGRLQDAAGRSRGLTGFVVRQSDRGVRIGPESLTMGVRGILQNSVEFDGVRVTRDQMLGEAGQGMLVVEDVLAHGRLATAAVALGAAQRSAQLILRYASRREIETGRLLDNPQAGVEISEMMHRISIGKEMLAYAAARVDAGEAPIPEIAMAVKISCTDTGNFSANLLVQLLGGRGYMENNLAPQIFRDTRMLSIGEGANESLLAAVGRSLRMSDTLPAFLSSHPKGGYLAERILAISRALENRGEAGPYSGNVARVWQDAERGRLALGALELASAGNLTETETQQWARLQFEEICREAQQGSRQVAAALPPQRLRKQIEELSQTIGDMETIAPGVDFGLDPLLRRAERKEESRGPSAGEKKELLRRLLTTESLHLGETV